MNKQYNKLVRDKIPDQIPIWEQKHSEGNHEPLRHTPSPLSQLAEPYFPRDARILELGCGVGRDAVYFAQQGHHVIATDSSKIVIAQDNEHFPDSGVEFSVLDMRKKLPYEPESFDVVYANLSLHYYSHEQTKGIVHEIARVMKAGGILAFACKALGDPHQLIDEEVAKDIYVSKSGHVRHLFSKPYAQELLGELFEIKYMDVLAEEYSGEQSNILRCIAEKEVT